MIEAWSSYSPFSGASPINGKPYDHRNGQFWALVEPEEYPCDCRLWLGNRTWNGYGYWTPPECSNGTHLSAHSWAFKWSPWNHGQPYEQIRHLCGLAPCCNPLHLVPGTRADNFADAADHRLMSQSITTEQREWMLGSGLNFKELSRVMNLPGGVTYKVLHARPGRFVLRPETHGPIAVGRKKRRLA